MRSPPHLLLEQPGQRCRRRDQAGAVPVGEHLAQPGAVEQRQFADRSVRVGGDPRQQGQQVTSHPLDRGRVEQVGVVLHGHRQRVPARQELDHQVEPAPRAGQVLLADPQVADLPGVNHPWLQHHQGLHERGAAGVALRLHRVHDLVERQLTVGERLQHGFPDLTKEFAEGTRRVHPRPQHQGVDEEADHLFQLGVPPAGDRGTDSEVLLAAIARQQHLHGRGERHEQGRALLLAELGESADEVRRQLAAVDRTGCAAQLRPGPVGGQLQRPQTGELAPPVQQLPLTQPGVQVFPLPARVIRVLQGQGRRVGTGVARDQLVDEQADGPAVGDDVVLRQQQHVVLGGQPDQQHPGERACGQVEGQVELVGEHLVQHRIVHNGQFAQRDRRVLSNQLHRLPVNGVERGAQGGVLFGEAVQRGTQRLDVQRAGQPEPDAGVVLGAAGSQLVQQPEPVLRRRERELPAVRCGDDPFT